MSNPDEQGWVPPSYLVATKPEDKLDTRSTREVFREDIIKIDDKAKEAIMKRRWEASYTILFADPRSNLSNMIWIIARQGMFFNVLLF